MLINKLKLYINSVPTSITKSVGRTRNHGETDMSMPIKASEVLSSYLKQCQEPPWTSYFIKYSDIKDDQWGKSHFNWPVGASNYHVLRTGCYPYIKYHCTKRPHADLTIEDNFFRFIKCLNLGLPCLAYGIAAKFLIRHTEHVYFSKGRVVKIYFLYKEDKGSLH